MPTFKLDGRDVDFRAGEMVIEAAARAGVSIPYYCYHPELTRPANCRMCLVELKGAPKLIPACQQPVNDKMDIQTASERVKTAQADVMEFLLINHPLDCPICDQAGECKLQQYAYLFGRPASSMEEAKLKLEKRKVLGPHVVLDQERCIACTRCVRFTQEITKTSELTMIARGSHNVVDLHPRHELANAYSGCVVDMCPVGALTDRQFRFQARVWYVQPAPSTCTLCSRGCNITVDRRGERAHRTEMKRVRARRHPDVNASWICDEGRYGYRQPAEGARPVRAGGATAAAAPSLPPLERAQERAAEMLRAHGGQRGWLGVLASGAETLEELSSLAEVARAADPDALLVVPAFDDGDEDAILRRLDKVPNRRGARRLGFGDDSGGLAKRAVLLVADADVRPRAGLPEALVAGVARDAMVAFVAHERAWAERADVLLPLANAYEKEGTIVNFGNVVQRIRRIVSPPVDARPLHHHLAEIAALARLPPIETDTRARLAALCKGPLAPLDPARLGEWGARLSEKPGGEVTYFEEPPQLFTAAPKAYAEGEYLPFLKSQIPPPAIHVGAGAPARDDERFEWFGPIRTNVEEGASPGETS
jgi:NADH-quinone oxidoreductase subunit G